MTNGGPFPCFNSVRASITSPSNRCDPEHVSSVSGPAATPYAQPYDNHGTQLTECVKEVVWKDGNLPNEWYDEFAFRGTFAGILEPGKFYFLRCRNAPMAKRPGST